jgi:uncharacterized protein YjiS (DUF1127 family)
MRFMSNLLWDSSIRHGQLASVTGNRKERYTRNPGVAVVLCCAGEEPVTDILLRPGDVLRIEGDDGSVLTVSVPPGAELWEIQVGARRSRIVRALLGWWKHHTAAWHEERAARELAQLDERLLADIGLGPHAGNPLATRVHNYRQQELRRIEMGRLGLM